MGAARGSVSLRLLCFNLFMLFTLGATTALAVSDIQPVTFLDSPDPVPAGGIVSYQVVVQNNDPDDPAVNVQLTVDVPLGFSYNDDDPDCSYDPSGVDPSGGGANDRVICEWPTIDLNRTVTLEYTASDVPGSYAVEATASATNDSNTSNNVESNITDVVVGADLELAAKTGTPDPVEGGGIVTYSFTVINNGPFGADNLELTDTLPTGLTFVADNASPSAAQDGEWDCSAAGQDVSCTSPSLGNGNTSIFSFRVRATSATTGFINNSATVVAETPESAPDNNTASDALEIIEGTDMAITKTVDTSPVIGGIPVQFTLTATNIGPMTADNVEVNDTFPALYGDIATVSVPAGWSCDPIVGLTVTCRTASMAAGQSADIVLTATPPVVGATVTHQNAATVATTTPDPIGSNDSVIVNYDVMANIADLAITKSKGPSPVVQGSTMTTTITVRNNGPQPADIVSVADALDPGETYVSHSGDWTCTPLTPLQGGTVLCTYDNAPLATGATTTALTILTEATDTGYLTNIACTGGSGGSTEPTAGDTVTNNNCSGSGDGTVLSTAESADIQVTKDADDYLIDTTETSFQYTIDVYNAGPDTAEAVEFNDIIPQYVSAGPGGRPATTIVPLTSQGSCDPVSSGLVSCSLGDIAALDTVTVTITVIRPMADGLRTNTASAYSTLTGDPNRGNNESSRDVEVEPIVDLEVTDKLVTYTSQPGPIIAETLATYTIGIRNNGPSRADNVQLVDSFTGQPFEFVDYSLSGAGSCTWSAPNLTCDLQNMNSGTTKSLTVRVRPDHVFPNPAPWQIENTAAATTTTAESDLSNNSKSVTLAVQDGSADLAVEKNESPSFTEPVRFDPAAPAGTNYIVYEVVISNRGPSRATNVVFTDNVLTVSPLQGTPQQLQFVRDTENGDGSAGASTICSSPVPNPFSLNNGPDIDCVLPDPLLSGDNYSRYLVFEVLDSPDPLIGDSYNNSVTVSAEEPDPNLANNTEDEDTTVRTIVDLGIVKTSDKDTGANRVEVEENFDFTLTVTNHGPGLSPGAEITDSLPAGMVLTNQPYVSNNPFSITASCSGGINDTAYSCVLGQMADSQSIEITMPVKMTSYPTGGTTTNSATVTGIAPEPKVDPHPNTDSHTVGVLAQAVIGNRVWLDRDNDGIQDGGEPGINGVTVNLLNSGGSQIATTTTAGGGYYSFTINSAGDYSLEFVDPASYLDSPQDAGADDAADNDADPTTGRTSATNLSYGEVDNSWDAGYYQLVSLGNRVWLDSDADGFQDAGELGIGNVLVELFDDGDNSLGSVTTDDAGIYIFTDLDPGSYYVQITPPAWVGYLQSPEQDTTPNDNNNTDSNIAVSPSANVFRSGTITLSSGSEPNNDGDSDRNTNLTLDMGLVLPTSLGNRVWLDEDSNGVQDGGEPGLAGVTVQLRDDADTIIATTVTDTDGGYMFRGLAPDEYFVTVDPASLPTGMSQTTIYPDPGADFSNQNQSVDFGYPVTLTSEGENLTADFGYNWSPTGDVTGGDNNGALGDRVWIDSNGNGVQDGSERGVENVLLTLLGPGPDNIFATADDQILATTATGAAGTYIFDDLAAGTYMVEVTDSSAASHDILNVFNYTQTGDPDHFAASTASAVAGTAGDNQTTQPVVLAPGDTYVNVDFGYQPQPSASLLSIGDTVWLDLNRDGVFDAEETGIGGVTMGLQNDAAEFVATTTTAADGTYLFTDLPGTSQYTVVVVDSDNVLANMTPTYDNDYGTTNPDGSSTLTLGGLDDLDQDFGYIPINPGAGNGAIGDTIYLDRNGNSTDDAGEAMEGVRVFLRDGTGDVVATVFTDENGKYIFSGLAGGSYTIEVDTTTLPPGVSNSVDPDGGLDSISTLVLGPAEVNLDQDFGYVADTPNSIGNLIWQDRNADGQYQPGGLDGAGGTADDETPIEGVTVNLYRDLNTNGALDPGEPIIATTSTSANGLYLFEGLPDGSYLVDVSDRGNVLEGYFHSLGTAGADNNSQQDYYVVTVAGGTSNLTADFGYYHAPGSLGNLIFKDENVNGLYDSTIDTLLNGVTVYLDIEYPNGTVVTVETVTDANGLYSFAQLLLDENYNGIGTLYGNSGDEPSHTVRVDLATIPSPLAPVYPTRERNTDSTTVGGTPADDEDADFGSDSTAGEVGYPPQGSSDISNDFGFFEPGSIGDTIWNDQDNDGSFDGGEGLAGVTVRLTPPADVNLGAGLGNSATIVTGSGGSYLFADLPPGDYVVEVVESSLPPYLQGHNTVDPDFTTDSTSAVSLAIAEDNLNQDFAYFYPSSLGDFVWNDSNGNGLQDPGEPGRQGITVQLLDGSGNAVENPALPGVDYIVQTDGSGYYHFENLLPETYQIRFVLPVNSSFTLQDSGGDDSADSDADPSTGLVTVNLGANEVNLSIDAGLVGPAINIEKSTNGSDADTPPGVTLAVGDSVTWEYVVTNSGNVSLGSIAVSDDQVGAISCPQTILNAGASMTCSASGTAAAGQYANIASVVGSPPTGPAVVDSDPSHYLAGSAVAAVDIEKSTNGIDADSGTGPVIGVGEEVVWTYVITNTGNDVLNAITVSDDMIGAVSCPQNSLNVAESMNCTALGTAVAGQYENIGSVIAIPQSGGMDVTDSDPSHYYGNVSGGDFAAVDLEKHTQGVDADTAPGPYAETGYGVVWTYIVTNTGDVDLTNVTVTDDMLPDTAISCPNDGNIDNSILLLPVGASATCTATGTAAAGQYANTGYVVGTPPTGPDVTDSDPSHYYGAGGSIDIEKHTNGSDADVPPGPTLRVGRDVNWTYVVTNTGPFALTDVDVVDDQGETVSCPQTTLAPGEQMTCTATSTVIEGQYANIGSVTASTPEDATVSDSDPSHYLGSDFFWGLFMPAITPSCPPVPDYCYIVADGDNMGSRNSALFSYVFSDNNMELLNRLGVGDVETIVLSPDGKTLYGADNGVLGIIDPTQIGSGSFSPIDARGVGIGRGKLGSIAIDDIDGLAFAPGGGALYASVRYGDGMVDDGSLDLLIKLDHKTGRIIRNGFGNGRDYVVIKTAAIGANDVDDLAFDRDGTLFGIAGNSGSGGDRLIIIDTATGVTTDFGALHDGTSLVQDMEGLTMYNSRELYGTTGLEFVSQQTDNTLYKIDKKTGQTTPVVKLDNDFQGYYPGDFEAIACFPVCIR